MKFCDKKNTLSHPIFGGHVALPLSYRNGNSMRLTTTNISTMQLQRTECSAKLVSNTLKELLDNTYNYIANTSSSDYEAYPMWLFKFYSDIEDVSSEEDLRYNEKIDAINNIRKEFNDALIVNLGVTNASIVFNKNVNHNLKIGNDNRIGLFAPAQMCA